MQKYEFSPKKKDRMKAFRSVLEAIILISLLALILKALLPSRPYSPIKDEDRVQTENGFIAISYFGVDRMGAQSLISASRLDEHLKALSSQGYVTVTQQDILDYLENKKALPQKALFLIFEDGRRDTGIFAQKIMENYNFKATMMTYAQNLELNDSKFLRADDLKDLEKSSFWELGSNGYRLSYINVFDRYGNFLDQLDTYEFSRVSKYLDRNYNHYLMDYIRDENGVPKEIKYQMQERIALDYSKLKQTYLEKIKKVPVMYALMHSNTGKFGTNDAVSAENEKWIKEIFKLNFNREGVCLNTYETSPYDLTRIQPQAYWYPNHLLMRIWNDTKEDMNFVSGDSERGKAWETVLGAAEFRGNEIVLTSLPADHGLMRLKDSGNYSDVTFSAELKGNKAGVQSVYLRADEDLNNYICVRLADNVIHVYEKGKDDKEKTELYSINLDEFDGTVYQSVEENKLEAEIAEIKTAIKYAPDKETAAKLLAELNEKMKQKPKSTSEGGEEYNPETELSEPGDRKIEIKLSGENLSIWIDGKPLVEALKVKNADKGSVYIESAFGGYAYSQRNIVDNVYDGVFKDVVVYANGGENPFYDNRLHGFDKFKDSAKNIWDMIINFFIEYL